MGQIEYGAARSRDTKKSEPPMSPLKEEGYNGFKVLGAVLFVIWTLYLIT